MGAASTTLKETFDGFLKEAREVPIQEEAFWAKLWPTENVSMKQIVEAVTAEGIRDLMEKNPKNFKTFLRRAICTLSKHTYAGALHSMPAKFQVTTIVRLLTRVIPLVHENPEWADFWLTPTPVGINITLPEDSIAPVALHGVPQNLRERLQAELEKDLKAAEPPTNPPPPIYQTLIVAIMDLMFAPGYTVYENKPRTIPHGSVPPQGTRPPAVLDASNLAWYAGVEVEKAFPEKPSLTAHQCDMIRLLQACISRSLYLDVQDFDLRSDLFLSYVVGGYHRHSTVFMRSLLNAVLSYDPVGMGLPYNYVLVPMQDREDLMTLCGQLMCLFLDFVPYPTAADGDEAAYGPNAVIDWIASFKDDAVFEFIATQVGVLLRNPLQVYYIPSSYKSINAHHELLVLFWRLCEANKGFVHYLMKTGKVLDVLMPLLFRLNEAKSDDGDFGLVQVCVYTLLLLSGQRNFSVHLNTEWDGAVAFPGIPFSSGNYADLLIMVIHGVLVADNPRLTSLYELLLTIIVNVAPFIKRLSLEAANKLVHLFRVFSSPRYIFASEANHRLVFFLLEAFNSLIQYQFEGNQHFVYCIIRVRDLFQRLASLTIPGPAAEDNDDSAEGDGEDDASAEGTDALTTNTVQEDEREGDNAAVTTSTTSQNGADSDSDDAIAQNPVQKTPTYPADATATASVDVRAQHQDGVEDDDEDEASNNGAPTPKKMVIATPVRTDTTEHPTVQKQLTSQEPIAQYFTPTQEWFESWHHQLPLQTILRLLRVLVPQIQDLCQKNGVTHEIEIVEFLKKGTLVGLLPVPPQIITRKYQGSGRSSVWFTSFMWSVLFLKSIDIPNFLDTHVTLFDVKTSDE